jgi:diaminopimelate decarboxylase
VIQARLRRPVPVLNLGGGYSNDFATAAFASRVRGMLALATDRYAIVPPRLTVSPGRALVGPAGTTVYRLLDPDTVDGPDCTCGEPHAARLVGRISRAPLNPMTVAGVPVLLPADTTRGDLIALSGTGAYHHNDAHATVLGLRDGRASVLAERTELFR